MRSKFIFLHVEISFDMQKCEFSLKNVGCVFAYFCGGHKIYIFRYVVVALLIC